MFSSVLFSLQEKKEDDIQSFTKIQLEDGAVLRYKHKIECSSLQQSTEHSDLIPGVYEGLSEYLSLVRHLHDVYSLSYLSSSVPRWRQNMGMFLHAARLPL